MNFNPGGGSLTTPASHATVRAVRHTAVSTVVLQNWSAVPGTLEAPRRTSGIPSPTAGGGPPKRLLRKVQWNRDREPRDRFGPSPLCAPARMASADSWRLLDPPCDESGPMARLQVSQGKTRACRPISPPHLRRAGPGAIGLQVSLPPRPPPQRLLCGACASGRGFACGFLPTPSRGDAVAVRLGVPGTHFPRGLAPPRHAPCLAHPREGVKRFA